MHQCAVNGDSTVLVAGGTAGAGAGYAVVILLSDDGRLEAAFDLHMQLVGVALTIVFRNGSLTVRINNQFEGQIFVAGCHDGDDIAAFENVCSGADVTFFGKCQNQCFGLVHIA